MNPLLLLLILSGLGILSTVALPEKYAGLADLVVITGMVVVFLVMILALVFNNGRMTT